MSTQRQLKVYTPLPLCLCGKPPKAYITDNALHHLECYACQYITPKLHSLALAITFFSRITEAVRFDALQHNHSKPKMGIR